MKRYRFSALLCLFFLLLHTGCETSSSEYYDPIDRATLSGEVLATDEREYGYLIGSVAYSGDIPRSLRTALTGNGDFRYSAYYLVFRKMGEVESVGSIGMKASAWDGSYALDYRFSEGGGQFFTVKLPVGDYEFFNYYLHYYSSIFRSSAESSKNASVTPFTVTSGKAIYIGEIKIIHQFREHWSGGMTPDGGIIQVSDMSSEHIPKILQAYPFLTNITIETNLLNNLEQLSKSRR